MKTLAAFLVALAMVVPLSMAFAPVSDAEPDDDGLLLGDGWQDLLPDWEDFIDYENVELTGSITDDMTIAAGERGVIVDDLVLSPGVVITVKEDAALCFVFTSSFSITGGAGSGFYLEEGSVIGTAEKYLKATTDVEILINGQFDYDVTYNFDTQDLSNIALDADITVAKGTVLNINGIEATFVDGSSATCNVTMNLDLKTFSFNGSIAADIDCGTIAIDVYGYEIVVESAETVLTGTIVPGNNGDYKITLVEDGDAKITFDGQELDVSDEANIILTISGVESLSSFEDVEISITGSYEFEAAMDTYKTDHATMKGASLELEVVFDDKVVAVEAETAIKEMTSDITRDGVRYTGSIDNFSAEGTFVMDATDFDMEKAMEIIQELTEDGKFAPADLEELEELIEAILALVDLSGTSTVVLDEYTYKVVGEDIYVLAAIEGLTSDAAFSTKGGIEYSETLELDSVEYDVVMENTEQYYLLNGLAVSAGTDINGAEMTLEILEIANHVDGKGTIMDVSDVKTTVSFKDFVISERSTGSYEIKQYEDYTLSDTSSVNNMVFAASLDLTKVDWSDLKTIISAVVIEEISGEIKTTIDGIAIDYGKVTFDTTDYTFVSPKITVSGKYVDDSGRDTIEMTATNVKGGFFYIVPEFDTASFTIVMKDGSKITDQITVDNEQQYFTEKIAVSGGFIYYDSIIMDSPAAFLLMDGYTKEMTVVGDGKLVLYSVDFSNNTYNGVVYVNGMVETDYQDYELFLDGLVIGVADAEPKLQNMFIQELDGYIADPDTYEGFTVDDNNMIVIELGATELVAGANGVPVNITVDGTEYVAEYGTLFNDITVAKDVLWMKDNAGNHYGLVINGHWYYYVDTTEDLVLTSVTGDNVDVKAGETVKSDSNNIIFAKPEGEEIFSVQTPTGLVFSVSSVMEYEGDNVLISNEKTKYEGKNAFEITANGDTYVKFPVSSYNAKLNHVINGVPVEMIGDYTEENGQIYLGALLTSYSVYYIDDGSSSGSGIDMTMVAIIVVAIIVILAIVFFVVKKKNAGAA